MVGFKGLNLGNLGQKVSSVKTPNLLSSTMGANGADVLKLAGGLGIGGTSGTDISGLLGGGAAGVGGFDPSSLLGGVLGGGGSNPFASVLGGLGGGQPNGAQAGGVGSDSLWQPNVLSGIDQPAYHVRFIMVGDDTAKQVQNSGDVSLLSNGLVIAETALTEFNITEVEITGFASPQSSNRNFSATNFNIKITEQMGASLLDRLYQGAKMAGIMNFHKAFYFVQVRFHGYDPSSGQYVDQLGGKTWTWCTKLTDLTVDVNEGGAKYVATMVTADSFPAFSHFGMINLSFAPSASTIGEFFNKLKQNLEQAQVPLYGYVRHTYNFVLHQVPLELNVLSSVSPDPTNWAIQNPDFSQQHSRSTSTQSTAGETETGVETQISMKDVVSKVFASALEAQQLIARSADPTVPSNQAYNAVIWKVVCDFRYTAGPLYYDPIHDDYNYDVTFHIIPHVSTDIMMSVEQREDSVNQGLIDQKVQALQQQGRLVKQYQYLFTGLNTEVIDFDIQTNLFWFGWVPNSMQSQADSSQSTPEMMSDKQFDNQTMPNLKALTDPLLQQIQQLSGSSGGSNGFGNALKIAELSGKIQSILQQALNSSQPTNTTGQTIDGYLEQIPTDGYKTPIAYDKPVHALDRTLMGEVESDIGSGQAVYAMAINQAFGVNGPLVNLDMTVRGDPYWLGYSMIELQPGPQAIQAAYSKQFPDYYMADNTVMMQFAFPQGVDEATGEPILRPVNLFTGFYNVHTVTHKFSAGKFTQNLKGIRINALGKEFAPEGAAASSSGSPIPGMPSNVFDSLSGTGGFNTLSNGANNGLGSILPNLRGTGGFNG